MTASQTETHQVACRFSILVISLAVAWMLLDGAGRADAQTGTVAFTQSSYTAFNGSGSVVIPIVFSTTSTISNTIASVTAFTSNGTATAGVDYLPFNGVVTLSATSPDGLLVSATNTFTITLLNNLAAASNTTVILSLTNATNATLGSPATAVLTLFNTNSTQAVVQFAQAAYSVDDTNTEAVIALARSGAGGTTAAVDFKTIDGSALAGVEYTATTGTVTFAANAFTNEFTIPLLPPGPLETNKTVTLTLTNPATGTVLGPQTTAVLTIVPTAPPVIQFSAPSYHVHEHGGPAVITAVRFGNTRTNSSVIYATSDGTAVSGRDYLGTSGTLNYGDGDTAKSFSVYLTEFKSFQSNKTFNVTLNNATGGGASLGTQDTAVVTIVNDRPQTITFTNANGAIVTLTLKSGGAMVLDQPDPLRLALFGTDEGSTLQIKIKSRKKGGRVQTIDTIISDGGARLIDARFSDLTGTGIILGGFLGGLKIHNIYSNATISALGNGAQKTTIAAWNIDQTTISLGSRLEQLRAGQFGAGTITASSLGSLTIKGNQRQKLPGNFQADVMLTATAPETNQLNLTAVVVSGVISNSMFDVPAGSAGSIKAGAMIDSGIFVSFTPTHPNLPLAGGLFSSSDSLNQVSVTAKTNGFIDSFIVAPFIGNVRLASVMTNNHGTNFGVLAGQSIGSVTVHSPLFHWKNSGSSDQSLGDFHVIF